MRHYIKIYFTLLRLSWLSLIMYRANFINSIFSTLIWSTLTMTTMFLITSHSSSVFGWSRNELLLLSAIYNVFIGLFNFFFKYNFKQFVNMVNLGQLDGFLVKPLDSQFLISFWQMNFTGMVRSVFGVFITLYLLHLMQVSIVFANVVGFI